MVAALDSHRGKGLGNLLNAAVLRRLQELGFEKAHLLTDDWRIPAIRSYLSAGFRPDRTHRTHRKRWKLIFREIERLQG